LNFVTVFVQTTSELNANNYHENYVCASDA